MRTDEARVVRRSAALLHERDGSTAERYLSCAPVYPFLLSLEATFPKHEEIKKSTTLPVFIPAWVGGKVKKKEKKM